MPITEGRPLRADAERNRQRLLHSAAELFRTRGLEVSMDDIAAHAGVGVGTAYRRFRSREELIDALFDERMSEFTEVMTECAADPDPWNGIVAFLEASLEMQAADRGLKQLFHSRKHDNDQVAEIHDHLFSVMQTMVDRAHASGDLRADVSAIDLTVVSLMAGSVADVTAEQAPAAWRRALTLALDGLRGDGRRTEPLPGPPMTRQEFEAALECWRPPAQPAP